MGLAGFRHTQATNTCTHVPARMYAHARAHAHAPLLASGHGQLAPMVKASLDSETLGVRNKVFCLDRLFEAVTLTKMETCAVALLLV